MKKAALLLLTLCALGISHETLTTTVLFDREIVRILDQHCVMCHASGGPAIPLETYEQTWLQKRPIRADVIARHMPPWAAVPGYGQFANDNSLTLRETQFIVSWVEGLGPRNAGTVFTNTAIPGAAQPKEVRAHSDFGVWQLGRPEVVRQVPPAIIDPEKDQKQRSVIDLGLSSPRLLRAFEFLPGDRRAVRAASLTLQETGQWLGSWTPWRTFVTLPGGVAFRLPAGAHVIADIYYKGVKEPATGSGQLGLFFASAAASNPVSNLVLQAPAGGNGIAKASMQLPADTQVLSLFPELRPGVQSIEVSARKPNGAIQVLLFAKDFPMDWPTPYVFKDPVALPKGAELTITAHFSAAAQPLSLTVSTFHNKP